MTEWEALVRKWWGRLIEQPGWRLDFVTQQDLDSPAQVVFHLRERTASFILRASDSPSDRLACHEVVHIMVHCYAGPVKTVMDCGEAETPKVVQLMLGDAEEDMVALLTRAFLKAYKEDDNG